jgi:hypothetical protein
VTLVGMRDHISRAEIRKDALQDSVETTATAVGTVATIVTTAVRDVARTLGGLATDLFEIRESVRRARDDHHPADAGPGDSPTRAERTPD